VLAVVGFYVVLTVLVGMARGQYGVAAPATTGHPDFERRLRVQVNTGEQLAPFFATLAIFAFVMGPGLATVACVAWLLGRILYAVGYSRAPRLRYPGFALSMFVLCAMIVWTFIVLAWSLIDHPSSNTIPYCTHAGECGIEH
jgi:glutathione S-transferase